MLENHRQVADTYITGVADPEKQKNFTQKIKKLGNFMPLMPDVIFGGLEAHVGFSCRMKALHGGLRIKILHL
jgi:hypothetical protein